jgi:TonB family protein
MRHPGKLLLFAVLATGARAADVPPGTLTRAPSVVEPATPEYPAGASAAGVSGEVVLEIDISPAGEVLDARVLEPGGHGFDEASLAAARRLRFSPAEIDGSPPP